MFFTPPARRELSRVAADKVEAFDRGRKGLPLGLGGVTVFPRSMNNSGQSFTNSSQDERVIGSAFDWVITTVSPNVR